MRCRDVVITLCVKSNYWQGANVTMQIIQKLSDMIDEELNDAEKYIKCAINHKDEHPNLANTFYKLSTEEMGHMMLLHEQVVHFINEYKREHGNPPEKMQVIYDYVHQKHMERANEIKIMQAIYKS